MASTISAATLTVTVTESILLNGSNMGATNTLSVASINEVNQRVVSIDAGATRTLFEFGVAVGAGKFIRANVKYVRITNKDDTNPVSINLASASSNCWITVTAGQSFVLSSASSTLEADDDAIVADPILQDLDKITAHGTNVIDLDCYIALT